MVTFRRIRPAPDLSPHVRHYWVLGSNAPGASVHPVFPDGCSELVFNLGPASHELLPSGMRSLQPVAMLVGQMTRPVRVVSGTTMRMVGVKLAPCGAAAILGEPGAMVRDTTAALSDVEGGLGGLGEQLDDCDDDHEIRAVLDAALRARLAAAASARLDRLRRFALALAAPPESSVDAWARSMGWSGRTLERHFERYVGLSPKEFARLRRFQRALGLTSARPDLRLAAIAARAGYSDQSHLGRDFRRFAGGPPSTTAASSTEVSAAFIGDLSDSY